MKPPDDNAVTLPPFWVMPVVETPSQLRRSPGVVAVVFVSIAVVGLGGAWPSVTRTLECTSVAIADGELWRLISYVLPHEGGWLHVVVNMAALSLFGWQYERIVGPARFIVVYLGSGAIGMALLFAFNPIDAERGLRSGASLAVFGIVAALATCHAVTGGWRGPAMPYAISTCVALLIASGIVGLRGHDQVIEPGLDAFRFGVLNHALGMVAGVLLGIAVPTYGTRETRLAAAMLAVAALGLGAGVGVMRWT